MPEPGDDARMVRRLQALQRRHVEMVIVIVADEHSIDMRQIRETHAGRPVAAAAEIRSGAGDVAPDRIGEQVQAVDLDQHGRVIDEGDAQLTVADVVGRRRRGRHVDPFRPPDAHA